jgi:oligoribonuclease NrnB/cAMP/cGMP phosphodiesterase (DHH superfamily)
MNQTSTTQNKATNAVVIYHANCNDGFASAWAFHLLKEKEYTEVEYLSNSYGDNRIEGAAKVVGWDVYILDFSYPRAELEKLCKWANKVVLIDHHKTAKEALENWEDKPANLEINFDMSKAGCLLTWEYFVKEPKVPTPKLIQYIADRDIWTFKLPYSKEINAVVAIRTQTFDAYSSLDHQLSYAWEEVRWSGASLLTQHEKICGEIIPLARDIQLKDEDGNTHLGLAANCNYQFASEVGNLLAKQSGTFGATYFSDSEGKVKFSIRSNGDYDVSKIAKAYGGGGHRNASGFTLTPEGTNGNIAVWKIL